MNTITITAHLGTGDEGRARKAALRKLAERGKHFYNGVPSVGRMLVAMADEAESKPEPRNLWADELPLVESALAAHHDLDGIEDAIDIIRLRQISRRLTANGFKITNGDSEGWGWMNCVIVHDPDSADCVYANLSECRVLLDTAREMDTPAAAFARWRPKVKEVRE